MVEGITRIQPDGIPASVKIDSGGRVRYCSSCEMVVEEEVEYETFWDLLEDWGGG